MSAKPNPARLESGSALVEFTAGVVHEYCETFSYEWDFGDGTSAVGADTVSHAYTRTGEFVVTATAICDGECDRRSATTKVKVICSPNEKNACGEDECLYCNEEGVCAEKAYEPVPLPESSISAITSNKEGISQEYPGVTGVNMDKDIEVDLSAQCEVGGRWRAQLESLTGYYFSFVQEEIILDPPASPDAKECVWAVAEVFNSHLDPTPGYEWHGNGLPLYASRAAVREHEAVHEAHMQPSLVEVAPEIEELLEKLTVSRDQFDRQTAREAMLLIARMGAHQDTGKWQDRYMEHSQYDHCKNLPRAVSHQSCGSIGNFGSACAKDVPYAISALQALCAYAEASFLKTQDESWGACLGPCQEMKENGYLP